MTATEKVFLKAYAAALAGKDCTASFTDVKSEELFSLAKNHGAANVIYYSLRHDEVPEDLREMLKKEHEQSVKRDEVRQEEERRVFAAFDKADINYLPLKGSVLRMYYPYTDMRYMDDTDVMIDVFLRKEAKAVMESCGYSKVSSGSGREVYENGDGNIFKLHLKSADGSEFHKKLMESAVPVGESGSRLSLNLNDFYIYIVSHFAKHVRVGDASIKSLSDIKVFFSRCGLKLDEKYVKAELEAMGLESFEAQLKKLIHAVFYGATPDELTEDFRDYVLLCSNKHNSNTKYDKATVKRNKELIASLELKKYKNGKIRMSAGDVFTALLLIVVLSFAAVFIGRGFFMGHNVRETLHRDDSKDISEDQTEESGAGEETSGTGIQMPERVYGTIAYKEGLYTGYLYGGLPDGTGTLVFNSGESYNGSFSQGEFNGNGLYKFNDGRRYDGMWYEGEINGDGTLYYADGSFISGNFFEGEPTGICVYECANGDIYEGPLKDGKWHGKGKFVWANGDLYEGEFEMGVRQGQGKYVYSDGDSYEGEWINDVPNGKGSYVISGNTFTGVFVEGVLEGEGTVVRKNGDTYMGYFVHNAFNDDEAEYKFASGGKYEGSFENGTFHGKGTITYPDGDIVKGNFEKGFLQGSAQYYYSKEGVWRTITYVNGKPQ